ncbi:MAG TPA: hypothetical protein VHD90_12295 [Phototrophicaceae bacterium]|nr:hypothetical protein [Phototrophicaceae bacterium]
MASKTRLTHALFLAIALILMAACTQAPVPQTVPTLAVLPSPTPTDTASPTPIPTWTNTPTATDTATSTFTATATDTATATLTFTPSLTNTPSVTPSNTPTFTLTPTNTVTPSPTDTATFTPSPTNTNTPTSTFTPTPIPSPTIQGPNIVSFGSSMTSVFANTSITLAWVTDGDQARLDELNAQGAVITSLNVFPSGQQSISVPGNLGKTITFRLTVTRNGVQASQSLPITIACQYQLFFGQQYAPANAGCPTPPITSDGRYQSFERGVMFYVSGNGLNHVYGLQYDQSLYVGYTNGWDGSTLNTAAAPSGRFMPQEMLNWAYYNTLAPIGSWNSALGWATANIVNQQRTIQWENGIGGSNPFYLDSPDGGIYRFSGGDSGTWSRLR